VIYVGEGNERIESFKKKYNQNQIYRKKAPCNQDCGRAMRASIIKGREVRERGRKLNNRPQANGEWTIP